MPTRASCLFLLRGHLRTELPGEDRLILTWVTSGYFQLPRPPRTMSLGLILQGHCLCTNTVLVTAFGKENSKDTIPLLPT